jgi:hypothetical protein
MGFPSTTYGVSFEFEGFADASKASEVSEGSVVDFFEGFFAVSEEGFTSTTYGVCFEFEGFADASKASEVSEGSVVAGIGVFEGYATANEENLLF